MTEVFISYTRDEIAIARRFAQAFELAGLKVWWDQTLRSGEAYDEVTEGALRAAKAVVVLWSRKSVGSRWVRSEATLAHRQGTLLPVMIEACERPVMFELVQTADLSDWPGHTDHDAFRAFVADVRCRVTGDCDSMSPVDLATGTELRLPSKPSIAVLPFTDLCQDADHFADGITEELAVVLSRFSTLFVIAGQSSLSYRGSAKPAQTIARELGVRYLLEGSVRRSGGRVRISAKLIDAFVGEQIWAERFDDSAADIFDLQDRVANAVASTIDSTITDAEMRRSIARPTHSPDAYELTLKANALLCRYTADATREALADAERAVALDPENGWAVAIVGFCHATLGVNRWCDDPAAERAKALAIAEEAIGLARDDQMALTVTAGLLLTAPGDIRKARSLIERAIELNPGKAFIQFWAAWCDTVHGDHARGLQRFEQALRLDPRSAYRPFMLTGMGNCLLALERLEEAVVVLSEAARLAPHALARMPLAAACALSGRTEEACAQLAAMDGQPSLADAAERSADPRMRALFERAEAALTRLRAA